MNKRIRRVSVALAATGTAAIGFGGVPATAAAHAGHAGHEGCTPSITALPLPSGMINGDLLAVRGRRAAGFIGDGTHQHAAVWTRGAHTWQLRDLGDFGVTAANEPLSATGLDRRGDVAVGINSDLMAGWLVTRSGTHQLKDFAGGTNAYVRAINGRGKMVGEALDASGNDFAAVWPHWWSRPFRLDPARGYDGSYAQGISDRGEVVGGSFSFGSLPTVATRWWSRHANGRALRATRDAEATNVNTGGTIIGRALADPATALVWQGSQPARTLGLFSDSTFARPLGINDHGDVVGFMGDNPEGQIPVRHVMFWPGSGPTKSLLPLSGHWADGALSYVVTAGGTVFGSSSPTHESLPRPTIWRCAAAQAFVPGPHGPPAGYHAPPVLGLGASAPRTH